MVDVKLLDRKRELMAMSIGFLLDSGAAYRCPEQGHAGVLLDCYNPKAQRRAYTASLNAVGAPEHLAVQQAMLEAQKGIADVCWLCSMGHLIH